MAPGLQPDVWGGVRKKFQITNLTIHNSICFMKHALKSVLGLADVGVLHGDGVSPQNSTKMSGGSRKMFQMTNLTMVNLSCSMKYALKSVPGLADVGVLHGVGDGLRTPPRCLEGIGKSFK